MDPGAVGSDGKYVLLIMEVRMDSVRSESSATTEAGPVRQTTEVAADEAGNVAGTVADQARQVTDEVKTQVRSVAGDVRDRVAGQARTQNDKLADGLRQVSSELEKMAAGHEQSPARTVVMRIADGGHQAADYLSKHGPEGVLAEVQEFARRRPGAFLATALVSGFVVGRLGRGVFEAVTDSPPEQGRPYSPAPMTTGTTGSAAMPPAPVISAPMTEGRL
jgi:hypothetical protein